MADSFGPVVDAAWLAGALGDPTLRVVDFRWYLAGRSGADEHARGHIPGAVFVDLQRELTPPDGPGRHPIPPAAQVERALRAAGVSAGSRVVAYDDASGSVAARLWWLLRYYGHEGVAVLDGGLAAWTAAGRGLEAGAVAVAPGDFRAAPARRSWVVSKREVQARLGDRGAILLDARAAERFRGEVEPVDARPGHIPGARSAPWTGNLAGGVFRDAAALRARYEGLGATAGRDVVVYCGSGVTACHDLLALELAGLPGARLYEGSYSDWARDPALAVELGEG